VRALFVIFVISCAEFFSAFSDDMYFMCVLCSPTVECSRFCVFYVSLSLALSIYDSDASVCVACITRNSSVVDAGCLVIVHASCWCKHCFLALGSMRK
jgi:hypothetical protein